MPAQSIEALVDAMTLEEQVSLLSGEDIWSLPAIPRVGLGKLRVTDGPNGARGGGSLIGGVRSAAFPIGIALGATWDPELLREIGGALAEETRSKGAHVLLGPTINIHRSVTNGRNFECFAEDPVLTARLAVAYVEGLQAGGVAATPKHFAGNESEIQRTTMNSVVDERTLREVYLAPFEAVVKEAGTWALMTSYNRLNGPFTSESPWLISEVLRGDWGYDGLVMSDWFGSHSTAPTVNAGLDLEMPGPPRDRGPLLVDAVRRGEVAAATVRDRALAVLRLMQRTGSLAAPVALAERAEDRPAHRALIRRAGAEAAVLLKNDGILPLDPAAPGTIAVIGPNARVAQIMGGGSSQLNPHYRVSPWDGLAAALGDDRLVYAEGCGNLRFQPLLAGPLAAEFFNSPDLSGPVVHRASLDEAQAFWFGTDVGGGKVDPGNYSVRLTGRFVPEASGPHRVGVFSAGLARVLVDGRLVADAWTGWTAGRTFFEEGCDEVVGTVDLVAGQPAEVVVEFATRPAKLMAFAAFRVGLGLPLGDAAITAAVEAARAAEVALVFVGRNGEWDTEGSDLEDIRLPGRQDELVAAVAAANPRTVVVLQTGGPVEMPWLDAVPAVLQAWYPGTGGRQRHRRRAPRRRRARRAAPPDLPAHLGGQPHRQPRPRGLPGTGRPCPLRRRHLRRLPPLRPRRHRPALRLRPRPRLHPLRARSLRGRALGRRHRRPRHPAQHRRPPRRHRPANLPRRPRRRAPPPAEGAEGLRQAPRRARRDLHRHLPAHPPRPGLLRPGRRSLADRARQLRSLRRLLRHRHPRHRPDRGDRSPPHPPLRLTPARRVNESRHHYNHTYRIPYRFHTVSILSESP